MTDRHAPVDSPPHAGVAEQYLRLAIETIVASKTNPRQHFDEAYLAELAGSIRDKGVLQPILVRPIDAGNHKPKRYEIVAGECRVRAAKIAEQSHIPSVIRLYTDEQVLEIQLIENIHRKDLTPLEQARGYRALIDANPTKHSAESIATRIGMSPQWVWDRMKLNDLTPEAKKLLERDRMTVGHAILIARLKPEDQARALEPGDEDAYGDRGRGGLWTEDHARFDELADEDKRPKDKYDGLKARSVRELERWIHDHIRFDIAHMAKAVPLQFERTAAVVDEAAQRPGRGKKIIAITHEYRVADDARDDKERTFGSQSWERADGKAKSKTCDHSVLGVVVTGSGQGETLEVCVARDKCRVHFGAVIRDKEKNAKLRERGQKGHAEKREAASAAREAREAEQRKARDERFRKFVPALRQATHAAAQALPQVLPKAILQKILAAHRLPPKTKQAQLAKALLADALDDVFRSAWHGDEARMIGWAKLLGVDVKACEPTAPEVQTTVVKAKKKAKAA